MHLGVPVLVILCQLLIVFTCLKHARKPESLPPRHTHTSISRPYFPGNAHCSTSFNDFFPHVVCKLLSLVSYIFAPCFSASFLLRVNTLFIHLVTPTQVHPDPHQPALSRRTHSSCDFNGFCSHVFSYLLTSLPHFCLFQAV